MKVTTDSRGLKVHLSIAEGFELCLAIQIALANGDDYLDAQPKRRDKEARLQCRLVRKSSATLLALAERMSRKVGKRNAKMDADMILGALRAPGRKPPR